MRKYYNTQKIVILGYAQENLEEGGGGEGMDGWDVSCSCPCLKQSITISEKKVNRIFMALNKDIFGVIFIFFIFFYFIL